MRSHHTQENDMKGLIKVLFTVLVGLSLSMSSAYAAQCKGKIASACSSSSSCNWVKGYQRKDGATVKAHCRAAKGKSTLEKKASSKKATSTKDSVKSTSKKTTSTKNSLKSSSKDKNLKMKNKVNKKKTTQSKKDL